MAAAKYWNGSSWVYLAVGQQGPTGPQGPTGATGQGVPTGGNTGQVLAKASATNYDTSWIDPPTSGVSMASVFLLMGA